MLFLLFDGGVVGWVVLQFILVPPSRPALFSRAGRPDRIVVYLMILMSMVVSGSFPQGCFVSLLADGCSWRLAWCMG